MLVDLAIEHNSIMATYGRFPLTLTKGKGSYVWDEQGKKYLDYTSGIATCNLGHVPESVKGQVEKQLSQLWHCSNLYNIPSQQALADKLVENSCGDKVFFCNSGAEANEAAIKIARKYAKEIKGINAIEIVTFKQSFHGRTLATMSATGQEKIQKGFGPLVPGFRYVPFNDMETLEQAISPNTCAVLVELIQGEGGVIPAEKEWVQCLARMCKENEVLLMVDEIQTGMGRTGTLFAYQQYGIEPDVISLAKGLGSGFPIGAIIAKDAVSKAFVPGSHGSTFGGNPLATTSGLATINHILDSGIIENAAEIGDYLVSQLKILQHKHSTIIDIRGLGCMQGIVVTCDAMLVVEKAREHRLLILIAGANVVRVLPPLNTTKGEVDIFISVLDKVFQNI